MRPRSRRSLSAAVAVFSLLPAAVQAHVNPLCGGQRLSPEDNHLQFERVARLDEAEPASSMPVAQPVPAQTIRLAEQLAP